MLKTALWVIADYAMLALALQASVMFPHDGPVDRNLLINSFGIPVPIMIVGAVLGIYHTPLLEVVPTMWKFMVAAAAGFVVWSPMLDIFRPDHLRMIDIGIFLIAGYGVMFNTRVIAREWVLWRQRGSAASR